MRKFVRFFLALPVFLLSIHAALSAEPDSIQKKELVLLVNDLNNASAHQNMDVIANNMPARLYQEMAKRMNTTESALRDSLKQQLNSQFSKLKAGAYQMNADAIEFKETDDKRSFYALVPTRVETENAILEYMTLAIYDNTKWHLVYGGQKTVQNPVFLEIYPELSGVHVPQETVTKK